MAAKRSASEMRLIRSATAYRRLAWKSSTTAKQAERYQRRADQMMRQADEIAARRARSAS